MPSKHDLDDTHESVSMVFSDIFYCIIGKVTKYEAREMMVSRDSLDGIQNSDKAFKSFLDGNYYLLHYK